MDKQAALRAQIEVLITQEEDKTMKAVLLIMLSLHDGLGDLGGRIDGLANRIEGMRADIPGLKQAVLNGHAEVHHDDHEWLARLRAEWPRFEQSIKWVDEQRKDADDIKAENRKAAIAAKWRLYERLAWAVATLWLASKALPGVLGG